MSFKNIPKFLGHWPNFTEVITKKNIKQTDKFTKCRLRKFLERNHHEAQIFPTTTTKKKVIKIGAFFENISVYKHKKSIQTNCLTFFLGKSVKKSCHTYDVRH